MGNLSRLALWRGDDAQAQEYARHAVDIANAVQDRYWEGIASWSLGNAELALGRHAAAAAAFEQAEAVGLAIDNVTKHEAPAGRARVALAQGDGTAARQHVERVLAHLASGGTLEGAEAPRLIQLTCYEVLARAGDPRGVDMLHDVHAELQRLADAISDSAVRHGFLNNIPEHRDIIAAWQANQAGRETPDRVADERSDDGSC